jgi:catechol-2,3-dioxygenase
MISKESLLSVVMMSFFHYAVKGKSHVHLKVSNVLDLPIFYKQFFGIRILKEDEHSYTILMSSYLHHINKYHVNGRIPCIT